MTTWQITIEVRSDVLAADEIDDAMDLAYDTFTDSLYDVDQDATINAWYSNQMRNDEDVRTF